MPFWKRQPEVKTAVGLGNLRFKLEDIPRLRTKEGMKIEYFDGTDGGREYTVSAPRGNDMWMDEPIYLNREEVKGDLDLGYMSVKRNGRIYFGDQTDGLMIYPDGDVYLNARPPAVPKKPMHKQPAAKYCVAGAALAAAAFFFRRA